MPLSETRQIDDPDLEFLAQPRQLFVDWAEFEIEGKPLFAECREHLDAASAVIEQGRKITNAIHGTKPVSTPRSIKCNSSLAADHSEAQGQGFVGFVGHCRASRTA